MAQVRKRVTKRVGVDFEGPWFVKDPALTFQQNSHKMMVEIAAFGERDVKARVPSKTGALREGIVGRANSVRTGRRWDFRATVTATHVYPWEHKRRGIRPQAEYRGGKVVRPIMRRAMSDLRKFRSEMERELMKGLT